MTFKGAPLQGPLKRAPLQGPLKGAPWGSGEPRYFCPEAVGALPPPYKKLLRRSSLQGAPYKELLMTPLTHQNLFKRGPGAAPGRPGGAPGGPGPVLEAQ